MIALGVRMGFKNQPTVLDSICLPWQQVPSLVWWRFRSEETNNKIASQFIDTEFLYIFVCQRPGKSPGLGKQRKKEIILTIKDHMHTKKLKYWGIFQQKAQRLPESDS